MKNRWIAVLAALATIVATVASVVLAPYVEQKVKAAESPLLVKELYTPDTGHMDPEVSKQVTLVPWKYTLRHGRGRPAEQVTVQISSVAPIDIQEISFDPSSEVFDKKQLRDGFVIVDVPLMRPGSHISFETMRKPDSPIEVTELAREGKVVSSAEFEHIIKQSESPLVRVGVKAALAVVALLWLGALGAVIAIALFIRNRWRAMDGTDSQPIPVRRGLVVTLIMGLILYDLMLGFLGPVQAFIPLPRISVGTLFYAFLFYLLVTRYHLIDPLLSRKQLTRDQGGQPRPPEEPKEKIGG